MDRQIRKIKKLNKKEGKQLEALEAADKKRDPACHLGQKLLKKRKK
jgi:hypothetical protein